MMPPSLQSPPISKRGRIVINADISNSSPVKDTKGFHFNQRVEIKSVGDISIRINVQGLDKRWCYANTRCFVSIMRERPRTKTTPCNAICTEMYIQCGRMPVREGATQCERKQQELGNSK